MNHPVNYNFMPGIRCPHCKKFQHAEVSGWGRTGLNVRGKVCKNCGMDFSVVIYVGTADAEEVGSDLHILTLKDDIKKLRRTREAFERSLHQTRALEVVKLSGRDN